MQNYVISVFGRKGCGKSTLVKEIVDEAPRVIVFDTMGEYTRKRDHPVESFELAMMELGRIQHKNRFRLVLRLVDNEDALAAMRVAFDVGDCLFVVEETSFYCSPSYLPPELAQFVRYGRHRGIDQIYVSRRPAEIHRDLTAQSDLIVSFQQREPADIEYLRRSMGPEADRLPQLKKFSIMVSGEVSGAPLPILERLANGGKAPPFKPEKGRKRKIKAPEIDVDSGSDESV